MKKDYTTPQLFVHGSVEAITLKSPKGCRGNDGHGNGQGLGNPCTS